jgi:hypothetical protein
MKAVRFWLLAFAALLIAASIFQRLWLQGRPLPIRFCVQRPMTQPEWETIARANIPVPMNFTVTDAFPYPRPGQSPLVTSQDIGKIRALASWGSLLPFRTVGIEVWSTNKVTLQVYERHTCELEFTKDTTGWHMEVVRGIVDYSSADAVPKLSFH